MRATHISHNLPSFPICSAAFLSANELLLGGGGGASRTGVKNKIKLLEIGEDSGINIVDEYELAAGEDAPMSMASDTKTKTFVCGINSSVELIQSGKNENCRSFVLKEKKLTVATTQSTLRSTDIDDYQKATVLSPTGDLLAALGTTDLSVLNFPSLTLAFASHRLDSEEYCDASISPSQLLAATSKNLYFYNLSTQKSTSKKGKSKQAALPALRLARKVPMPDSFDATTTSAYRAARFNPTNEKVVYAIVNTTPHRMKKTRSATRQSFILKIDVDSGNVIYMRKVGDQSVVAFDVSPNGKLLAYAFNDYTVGILDSHTLAPLYTVLKAHEFPIMALKFNPTSKILISGGADSNLRIVSVPDALGSSYSLTTIILLALLAVILAVVAKRMVQ